VLIPFGTGFDEDQHLVRVYDIAGLHFLPNRGENGEVPTLSEFFTLSYRRYFFQNQGSDLLLTDKFFIKPDFLNMYSISTRAVYPPLIYLPQTVFARYLWMKFSFPIIPGTIILRIVGMLIYVFGSYISIKIIPFGKWVLFVLALSPTALYQASTINADGFTNVVSFLFVSFVLRLITQEEKFSNRQIVFLVLLTLLVGFSKPGTVILILSLFALKKEKFQRLSQRSMVFLSAIASVTVTICWWKISMTNAAPSDLVGADLQLNTQVLFENPLDFFLFFVRTTINSMPPYIRTWIAAYGYWVGRVPNFVYWLFIVALTVSLLLEYRVSMISWKTRVFLIALSFISLASVLLQYNLVKYIPNSNVTILSAHGRYFVPFALPFFIALCGIISFPIKNRMIISIFVSICSTLALLFFILGLYMTYYAECHENLFLPNRCTLPHYQNIDTSTPPTIVVDSQTSITFQFINTCERLVSVELLIGEPSNNAEDIFRFSILDSQYTRIFSTDIPNPELIPLTRLKLDLSSISFVKDEMYIIAIDSINSSGGLELALRPVDAYPGQLRVNNDENHNDLIFYYSCSR